MLALVAAVGISAAGAVVWSRVVADDPDVDVVLQQPGTYLEPGASTNPPMPTGALPAVALEDVDGTAVELVADGRPMVVNLWFTTCPPCARELADLAAVHRDVGERVRFVGVNPLDSAGPMTRFASARGVTYELLRDPRSALADALGIAAYPVTLFVEPDGTIAATHGVIDAGELRRQIAELWP